MDLLSADGTVMADFVRRSPTEQAKAEGERLTRLPWIVWARLRDDLEPYLLERNVDGVVAASISHRRIAQIGAHRYFRIRGQKATHRRLARYFGARGDPAGNRSWTGRDARAFANLPYHLAESGQRAVLLRLLVDYGWLDRKLHLLGITELLEDFSWVEADGVSLPVRSCLELSRDALASSRGHLSAELLGRLRGSRSTPIRKLLARAEAERGEGALVPLSRSLTPADARSTRTLAGHHGEVYGVTLTPNERMVVSC
jgi:hypothetical protein